jgi:hypothetical protein
MQPVVPKATAIAASIVPTAMTSAGLVVSLAAGQNPNSYVTDLWAESFSSLRPVVRPSRS